MADGHQISHSQPERDSPGRHTEPEQIPVRDDVREGTSIVPDAVSSLLSAPPDGAPTRHASAINRLPSVALRRQLATGLVRRHGNAYLGRVLATASSESAQSSRLAANNRVQDASTASLTQSDSSLVHSVFDTTAVDLAESSRNVEDYVAPPVSDAPANLAAPLDLLEEIAVDQPVEDQRPVTSESVVEPLQTTEERGDPLTNPSVEAQNHASTPLDASRRPQAFDTTQLAIVARSASPTPFSLPVRTSGLLTAWSTRGPPVARKDIALRLRQPQTSDDSSSPAMMTLSARSGRAAVQRDDEDSGLAASLLGSARAKASTEQEALRGDADTKAGSIEAQAQSRGGELDSKAASEEASLDGTAAAQESQLTQDASTQSAAIQQQAGADAAQLSSQSASTSTTLQQDSASTGAELQGDAQSLQSEAQGTVATADADLAAESSALQSEGETGANDIAGQVAALDSQSTSQIETVKSATQSLLDERTELQSNAGGKGADPDAIQKRLDSHQERLVVAEGEQSTLSGIEETAEQISGKAISLWTGITGRASGLLERASGIAQSVWGTVQQSWTSLQGKASSALSGLKERATAAWTGLKGAATSAWSGLKERGTAIWTGVKDRATAAGRVIKERADAVWTGVKSVADSAWQGVQATVGPVVSAIGQKAQGVIGSVQGMLGKIGSILSGAIETLLGSVRKVASAAVAGLKSRADRAWNLVKSTGASLWQRVKGTGAGLWHRVKGVAGRAWEGVKSVAGKAWDGLKNAGTKAWTGLKDLGSRAWDGAKKAWEFVKGKAKQGLDWMKGVLQRLKKTAQRAIDFLKQKARDGLNLLKKGIDKVKSLLKRALDWLKQKWAWLKSLLKIRLCLDDRQLFDRHALEMPFFEHGIFIVTKGQVWDLGAPIGPTQVSHFAGGNVALKFAGAAGPGMLRNLCLTLIPLNRQAIGEASLHVPGEFSEDLKGSILMGGGINAGGNIIVQHNELSLGFNMTATGVGVDREKLTYDSGQVTLDRALSMALCFKGTIQAGGEQRIILGTGPAPDPFSGPLGFGGKKRSGPKPGDLVPKPLGGNVSSGAGAAPVPVQDLGAQGSGITLPGGGGIGFAPTPDIPQFKEKRRFTTPITLPPLTNEGCRRLTVKIRYRVQNGVLLIPEKIEFNYEEISPDDLIRDMLATIPAPVIPKDDRDADNEGDDETDNDPEDGDPTILAPVVKLPVDVSTHENVIGAGKGHTIAKHVGKSKVFLQNRLITEPRPPAATTFRSLPSANLIVNEVMTDTKSAIDAYMASSNTAPQAFRKSTVDAAKGIGIHRPAPPNDQNADEIRKQPLVQFPGARVVLHKKATAPDGWYILTSHPDV